MGTWSVSLKRSGFRRFVGITYLATFYLPPANWAGNYKTHSVCACVNVCVTFLKRAVHHTGCFSLAFSMFYDLIAYVFSFDVFSYLSP